MTRDNFRDWINRGAEKPFTTRMMLTELLQSGTSCECLKTGQFYQPDRINECKTCEDSFTTFDGHRFLNSFISSLTVWVSYMTKGIFIVNNYLLHILTNTCDPTFNF